MPNAAIVAAALTDHAARAYALFVGGLDTINNTSIQTPVQSIRVVENGPGGVSSMDFEVWDRGAAFTIGDDTPVSFWDLTNDVCLFRGTIDGWDSKPAFATGRIYSVGCVGVEAWLDWLIVQPAYTPAALHNLNASIARLAQSFGVLSASTGNAADGDATNPVGELATTVDSFNTLPYHDTTPVVLGVPLRQGIETLATAASYHGVWGTSLPASILFTVDFYMRLRVWRDDPAAQPDDYTTLTVTDTVAGTIAATRLDYNVELGDIEHEVYVEGGNAAGSGLFGDGTGIRGKQGSITDSTITTADEAARRARDYLAGTAASVRGTVNLENLAPATVATVHAGSFLALTDAPSGATGTYRIYSITKTFHGNGRQDWAVGFGGLPPSATRLMRRIIAARG